MPNDAKIGMVVGVGMVIAIAVLFYRKDLPAQVTQSTPNPAAIAARQADLPALPPPAAE